MCYGATPWAAEKRESVTISRHLYALKESLRWHTHPAAAARRMPLLQNLPEDCVSRILYYLGGEGIVRVHEVNQALRRSVKNKIHPKIAQFLYVEVHEHWWFQLHLLATIMIKMAMLLMNVMI